MGNLVRMDIYRMLRAKSFRICLILSFALALLATPFEWGMAQLARSLSSEAPRFPESVQLSYLISNPASGLIYMLAFLSIVIFFFADIEAGYIKNIAGQMPKKGFSVLSRFMAAILHNLLFLAAGLIGNILGALFLQKITTDGGLLNSILTFAVRFLLMQAVCTIMLLAVTSFRNKSLGMILAVMLGLPVMGLIYLGINTGLGQLFGDSVNITPYMPDQVLKESNPDALRAFLVSAVTIGIFLPLSIHVFDRKDVK